MGRSALFIGVFTKWHNMFCSTQYTYRPANVFASVHSLWTVAVSHFTQLICCWERNQNLYRSSSPSFCIRLVGNAVWLVFCCRPAQDKTLAECTIFLRHARACRCKPQRGNKPRIKHVLVSVASSLTFWKQYTAAGIFPRSEPTESARLALLGLPSFSVAYNFSLLFMSCPILSSLYFPSLLPRHSSYILPSPINFSCFCFLVQVTKCLYRPQNQFSLFPYYISHSWHGFSHTSVYICLSTCKISPNLQ
jgi:hypothetical protein